MGILTARSVFAAFAILLSFPAFGGDPAFAPEKDEPDLESARAFSPEYWTEGIHLTAGVGLATSVYTSRTQPAHSGAGPNVRTELGWYIYNGMAIELSSAVNYIRVKRSLALWDTQFALGIRTRIGRFFSIGNGEPYLRLFWGWGPAVALFSTPQVHGSDRYHLHGPLYGAGFGQAYRTDSGRVFFVELGVVTHAFRSVDGVREAGLLPETRFRSAVTDGSRIYNAHLSIGMLAF
jgi:hypothetical protein